MVALRAERLLVDPLTGERCVSWRARRIYAFPAAIRAKILSASSSRMTPTFARSTRRHPHRREQPNQDAHLAGTKAIRPEAADAQTGHDSRCDLHGDAIRIHQNESARAIVFAPSCHGASAFLPIASASGLWSFRFVVRTTASCGQKKAKTASPSREHNSRFRGSFGVFISCLST